MSVYYGVVKGNAVMLPEGMHLAEGLVVEIRPLSPRHKNSKQPPSEDLFKQRLLESTLLRGIKAPSSSLPQGDRAPIQVKGKPLSQMVLEERR